MDTFARLIVGLFLVFVAQLSHADGSVPQPLCTPVHPLETTVTGGPWCGSSPSAAVGAYAQALTAWATYGYNGGASNVQTYRVAASPACGATYCYVEKQQSIQPGTWAIFGGQAVTVAVASCPANSTLSGGACACNAGYQPNAGGTACSPIPPTCAVRSLGDTMLGPFTSKGNIGLSYTSCEAVTGGGCQHAYDVFMVQEYAGGYWAAARERTTGSTCTPGSGGMTPVPGSGNMGGTSGDGTGTGSAPAPGGSASQPSSTPPATTCGLGMCPGQVNGAQVCVACTSTSTGGVGGTGAASGASSTASSPAGVVPGTSSSTSGTTCSSGTCTTTTTTSTNNSNGTTTTTTGTTTGSKDSFCAANPGDANCADRKSTFSGTCSSTVCTGDAVECAIAQEQARRWCQVMDNAPASDAVVQASTAGDQPSWHPAKNGSTVNLSSGFDQTDIVAGSCPADQTVQVSHFTPVTIAFSKLCQPAQMLGNILVGLTALACLGIVFVRGS